MVKIEVHVISREIIKPSSPTIHNLQPYKLCLLDQLTPTYYASVVLFYPKSTEANTDDIQFLTHLKRSLSDTLNVLYPFSGRVKDNMFVDRFDEGVPFFEAKVNCSLSEFFEDPQIESLNQFLPCQPFAKESHDEVPLLIFQLSIFSCGGVALGGCISHKLGDGGTASTLLSVWSAISQGSSSRDFEALLPNLAKPSLVFPPRNDLPRQLFSLVDDMWFVENNSIIKRFVFDAKAIETLRDKAKGESDRKPTRTGALSSFLWKRYMATSLALSSSPRQCILNYVVNLRGRTKPLLVDGAIGNLVRTVGAVAKPEADLELHELANLMSKAVAIMEDQDFLKSIQGDEGFKTISDGLKQRGNFLAKEKPDGFVITSWSHLGLDDVNFGNRAPVWLGVCGKVGPAYMNFASLIETKWSRGSFEAWINLDEKRMAILEQDPEFLAYATPNPKIVVKPVDRS